MKAKVTNNSEISFIKAIDQNSKLSALSPGGSDTFGLVKNLTDVIAKYVEVELTKKGQVP